MSQDINVPATTVYDITHAMAPINGIDLHYVLEVNSNAPTLVMVNMASHNLTCWEVCSNISTYRVLISAAPANLAGTMRRSSPLRNIPMTLRG